MKTERSYEFPNARIVVRQDRTCREIPKWCPMISVERARGWVADALVQLRRYNIKSRKTARGDGMKTTNEKPRLVPRLVPVLVPGKAWRVDVRVGSRKNGTMRTAPVSEPVYTLAQAEFFIMNNRARDFEGALK